MFECICLFRGWFIKECRTLLPSFWIILFSYLYYPSMALSIFSELTLHYCVRQTYPSSIKISYSTTPNLAQNISSNKKGIYTQSNDNVIDPPCNCRVPSECPLDSRCQKSNVVYQCDVSTTTDTKAYIGLTSTPFKKRYYNHLHTLRNPSKRTATALSAYIWELNKARIMEGNKPDTGRGVK